MNEVATEVGDNWSVFYFEYPKDRLELWLVDLFHHISKIEEVKFPHFTIREFSPQFIGISLRILRDQNVAENVDSRLVTFLKRQACITKKTQKVTIMLGFVKGKSTLSGINHVVRHFLGFLDLWYS